MPPWFATAPKGVFENERGLTDDEIDTIVQVGRGGGAGRRPRPTRRPAKQWAEDANDGWTLGTPDFVVKMPEPYLVADDIYDINISFYAELTEDIMPEDTWVKGWEFRVGDNQDHAPHVLVRHRAGCLRAARTAVEDEGADVAGSELLSCVAEGGEADMLPEGFGVLLKTGSSVSFNMHYHKEPAEGSAALSSPEIGFFVADEPVKYKVINDSLYEPAGSRFRRTTRTTGSGRRASSRRTRWC